MAHPGEEGAVAPTVATMVVREHCSQRFAACPNGRVDSVDDLICVLLLASYSDVSALVQLEKLWLGEFSFNEQSRFRLTRFVAERFDLSVASSLVKMVSSYNEKVIANWIDGLWSRVVDSRAEVHTRCEALSKKLGSLLPEGKALDPHQVEMVDAFLTLGHRLLCADDMGLGKTMEAIGSVLAVSEDAFPVFIASPASVVYTWARVVEGWLSKVGATPVVVERGFSGAKLEGVEKPVIIGSYEQMTGYWEPIHQAHPRFVIFDESHYLARWESQRTRAALRIRAQAPYRLALSGTPMPNGRHRELYPQLKILDKEVFSHISVSGGDDRYPFLKRFCDPQPKPVGRNKDGSVRWKQGYEGRSNEHELGAILQRYQLRRTKGEVGLVGDASKTRYAIEVPLGRKEKLALAKVRDDVAAMLRARANQLMSDLESRGFPEKAIVEQVRKQMAAEVAVTMTKMRQMLGELKARWSFTRLNEHIEEGHRVVVFCEHHAVAELAASLYQEKLGDEEVLVGTGALSTKKRQELVDRAEGGEGKVIVLTRAFKEGITLISFTRGMLLERYWVPGWESQMEDRIYRRGQERDVSWDYLVCAGTIDDHMAEVVSWKERGQQQSYGSNEERVLTWLVPELSEAT